MLSFSSRVSVLIHARVTCTCHAAACGGYLWNKLTDPSTIHPYSFLTLEVWGRTKILSGSLPSESSLDPSILKPKRERERWRSRGKKINKEEDEWEKKKVKVNRKLIPGRSNFG